MELLIVQYPVYCQAVNSNNLNIFILKYQNHKKPLFKSTL